MYRGNYRAKIIKRLSPYVKTPLTQIYAIKGKTRGAIVCYDSCIIFKSKLPIELRDNYQFNNRHPQELHKNIVIEKLTFLLPKESEITKDKENLECFWQEIDNEAHIGFCFCRNKKIGLYYLWDYGG